MQTGEEYLGQAQILFGLRPIRLAYLVADGSADELLIAVDEASSRWGGVTEIILPYNHGGDRIEYLRLANEIHPVDYFVLISPPSPDLLTRLAAQIGKQPMTLEAFQSSGFGIHQLGLNDPDSANPSPRFVADPGRSISEAVALGYISSDEVRRQWAELSVAVAAAANWQDIVSAQIERRTVIYGTTINLRELPGTSALETPTTLAVVDPDSFFDAVQFWNMRALAPVRFGRAPMCLIRKQDLDDSLLRLLTERIERLAPRTTPDVVVCGLNVDTSELEQLANRAGWTIDRGTGLKVTLTGPSRSPRSSPISMRITEKPFVPTWGRWQVGAYTRQLVQLHGGRTIVDSDSPVEFVNGIGGQVRARFWGAPELALPPGDRFGQLFQDYAIIKEGAVEIQTGPDQRYTFNLKLPGPAQLLAASLSEATVALKPSDKGLLGSGILARLKDPNVLRQPYVISAIRALTTQRVAYDIKALRNEFPLVDQDVLERLARGLTNLRQDFRPLRDIAARIGGVEAKEIAPAVERLVETELAIRGMRVDCAICGLSSFLELALVQAVVRCPGCLSDAHVAVDPVRKEGELHYRLNSLVDRASDNGVLIHLLASTSLQQLNRRAYVLPGASLAFDGSEAETDIIGLADGEIWTGEAKPSAKYFTDDQLAHDMQIAVKLKAANHIMACLEALPEDMVTKAVERSRQEGLRLWTLEGPTGTLQNRP